MSGQRNVRLFGRQHFNDVLHDKHPGLASQVEDRIGAYAIMGDGGGVGTVKEVKAALERSKRIEENLVLEYRLLSKYIYIS
jgi:hypothetical protein